MKKTFFALLMAGFLLAVPAAQAQTINEYCPNEISVSYGVSVIGVAFNTIVDIAGTFSDISELADIDVTSVKSGGSKGIINASYLYHTSNVFAVGGSVGFNRMSVNVQDNTGKLTAASANIIFGMIDAKLNWFRRDIFGMYSKFGLGVMCINGNLVESASGNLWLPTAQISLIGMELGRQFCGFMELGAGMQGVAQIGVKYHF